jgi:electron transfer flavoprotein alpha subunit
MVQLSQVSPEHVVGVSGNIMIPVLGFLTGGIVGQCNHWHATGMSTTMITKMLCLASISGPLRLLPR